MSLTSQGFIYFEIFSFHKNNQPFFGLIWPWLTPHKCSCSFGGHKRWKGGEYCSPRDAPGASSGETPSASWTELWGLSLFPDGLSACLCVCVTTCYLKKNQKYLTLCVVPAGPGWPRLCHAQAVPPTAHPKADGFFSRLGSSSKPSYLGGSGDAETAVQGLENVRVLLVLFLFLLNFVLPLT